MIDDTRCFVAVVQNGSFTKAAKELGMAKSQLSRHIQRLERSLGLALLKRSTRQLHLTPAGEDFYPYCLNIASAYRAGINAIDRHKASLFGTLNISAPIALGKWLLTPALTHLLKQHPELHVRLKLDETIHELTGSDLDIAFRLSDQLEDSSLIAQPITKIEFAYYASPSFLNKHPQATPLDAQYQLPIKTNDYQADLAFCQAGLGLAQLPQTLAMPLTQSGQLSLIATPTALATKTLWAIYPSSNRDNPKLKKLLNLLQI